jgi:glycosyltransferase involved in cell wall biosynthesis
LILVTHPGRQHSHQVALALDRAGMLAGYWAGVPALAEQMARVPAFLQHRIARYAPVPLTGRPGRQVRWHPTTPGLRRLGDALLPPRAAAWVDLLACRRFDRWAAARLPRPGAPEAPDATQAPKAPDAVIACEVSALAIFRVARKLGMTTILDAPSLHHRAQDRLHGTTDPPALHRRVTRVKDLEIELADHILTVSELARETYLEAGVPPERVHAVLLGADLNLFTPGAEGVEPGGEFVFLFAGATIHRKGFDLLLEAFDRVLQRIPDARLRVVGPRGDAAGLLAGRATAGLSGRISVSGPVGQRELACELRRADCLVLPSRNDSYGMVVPEALACGVPVLVSSMVGSRVLVELGVNGWIVPAGDAAALAERMLDCATHREDVRRMRPACRRSAAAATWPAYHERLVELLRRLAPERAA